MNTGLPSIVVLLAVTWSYPLQCAGEETQQAIGALKRNLHEVQETIDAMQSAIDTIDRQISQSPPVAEPKAGSPRKSGTPATYAPNTAPYAIFVMGSDGTGLRQLCTVEGASGQGSPAWSDDGQWIAFDIWSKHTANSRIFVVRKDGTELREVAEGAMPVWSQSGDALFYHRYDGDNWGLWTARVNGEEQKMLAATVMTPQPRPGQELLAVTSFGRQLCLLEAPYTTPRNLHVPFELDFGFGWSPDGKRICGRSPGQDGQHKLVVIDVSDVASPVTTDLVTGEIAIHAKWSHRGDWILFAIATESAHKYQLHVVQPQHPDQVLLLQGQDPRRSNSDGAWSPDGSMIAFASNPVLAPNTFEPLIRVPKR